MSGPQAKHPKNISQTKCQTQSVVINMKKKGDTGKEFKKYSGSRLEEFFALAAELLAMLRLLGLSWPRHCVITGAAEFFST